MFWICSNRLIFYKDDRKCSVKIGEVCGSQPHKILYLVLKNKDGIKVNIPNTPNKILVLYTLDQSSGKFAFESFVNGF